MTNTKQPDYTRTLQQIMEMYIIPDIERRKSIGEIPGDKKYELHQAQVLFSSDGSKIVRLNSEVKILAKAKINKSINKGGTLYERDVDKIVSLELLPEEKDFGHFTFIKFKGAWVIAFSFIYDVSKATKLFEKGMEFVQTAKFCLRNNKWGAFSANLFYALENLVRARLYLFPNQEIRKSCKHGTLAGIVNRYYKNSSVISLNQKNTYNFLHRNIDKSRYDTEYTLTKSIANSLLKDCSQLITDIKQYINL